MSIKFCPDCQSILHAFTGSTNLQYQCVQCKKIFDHEPEDTLLFSESLELTESNQKYSDFIEGAAFDVVNPKVAKTCGNCSMPYMTKIYVDINDTLMYVCTCGNKVFGHEGDELSVAK